ncbi:uncharacterized protein CTHT_0021490 [Thermochaetoides thermophila DSM 1495]|uniref:Major facilitator superfamily (MFS) profile domain-containing protein n=1 Tax=Chaetomium thermophilum (strain DSM 1495 / CBS 144.50 / IMI 039719) TaxID=759272 RepID=G0S3J6_CHATD|nr:hypothetical protein CTHT_0021490 [Thermochaetoides thermophila DSM 1495]EGS20323.1 hypothetical protein CTHT_0021490 [Thermochaetoides thermophila DSM 1495]
MADNEKTSISTSHQEEAGNVQEAHYDHRSHSDKEKNTAHGSSSDLSSTAEVESINVGQRGRRASVATTARSHRESFYSQRSVDPAEVQAAVPGHDLDVELAQGRHSPTELARIQSHASVRSRLSRILTNTSARQRERIPFAPLPLTNLDEGIVGWDSQSDPAMPLNFPARKKWTMVSLLAAITFLTPFASSILAPGITALQKEFNNYNSVVGTMTVSVYLLGYVVGPLFLAPLSPTIGPVIGSFVSQTIGWRWSFWIVFITSVVVVATHELNNTETNPRVLIKRKVERLKKELGRDDLRSCYEINAEEKTHLQTLLNGLIRPTKMLFYSPLVFFVSLYIAFTYGTLYLLFTTIPTVFMQSYGWSLGLTGLVYICLGLGNLVGWAVITARSDRSVVRRTKENGGVFEPEMRLPISIYFSVFLPMTFFWYGWSAHYKTHWIVPIIGLFPYSFGGIGIFMPLTTYLVDCYPMYAASAIAANTVIRSLAGMLLPLAGPKMYETLGLGWGNSLLGFICILMIPVPLLLHRYGKKLRMMGMQL